MSFKRLAPLAIVGLLCVTGKDKFDTAPDKNPETNQKTAQTERKPGNNALPERSKFRSLLQEQLDNQRNQQELEEEFSKFAPILKEKLYDIGLEFETYSTKMGFTELIMSEEGYYFSIVLPDPLNISQNHKYSVVFYELRNGKHNNFVYIHANYLDELVDKIEAAYEDFIL